MALLRRNAAAESVTDGISNAVSEPISHGSNKPANLQKVISTGSTLLDLAISGGKIERGGVPGGMFIELFGPSGAGKTALLSELSASCQARGGQVKFCDPEARLDHAYSQIYGVNIGDRFEYCRPDTVSEMFAKEIWGWEPTKDDVINMIAADSIAALSTNLEMDNDDGDKMGMRRAKEFSEGLRKTCRLIANKNWLIVMSNQIRTGDGGKVSTPGGHGVPFYASLRIQVKPFFQGSKIVKKKKVGRKEVEKVIGICSECTIVKSSVDEPYRTAPVSIIFNYGIDTIRDELQYFKDYTGETSYNCFDKTFVALDSAIEYIEQNGMKKRLQDRTIELWNDVQSKFKYSRKVKERI